jgi:hypothetical protein
LHQEPDWESLARAQHTDSSADSSPNHSPNHTPRDSPVRELEADEQKLKPAPPPASAPSEQKPKSAAPPAAAHVQKPRPEMDAKERRKEASLREMVDKEKKSKEKKGKEGVEKEGTEKTKTRPKSISHFLHGIIKRKESENLSVDKNT